MIITGTSYGLTSSQLLSAASAYLLELPSSLKLEKGEAISAQVAIVNDQTALVIDGEQLPVTLPPELQAGDILSLEIVQTEPSVLAQIKNVSPAKPGLQSLGDTRALQDLLRLIRTESFAVIDSDSFPALTKLLPPLQGDAPQIELALRKLAALNPQSPEAAAAALLSAVAVRGDAEDRNILQTLTKRENALPQPLRTFIENLRSSGFERFKKFALDQFSQLSSLESRLADFMKAVHSTDDYALLLNTLDRASSLVRTDQRERFVTQLLLDFTRQLSSAEAQSINEHPLAQAALDELVNQASLPRSSAVIESMRRLAELLDVRTSSNAGQAADNSDTKIVLSALKAASFLSRIAAPAPDLLAAISRLVDESRALAQQPTVSSAKSAERFAALADTLRKLAPAQVLADFAEQASARLKELGDSPAAEIVRRSAALIAAARENAAPVITKRVLSEVTGGLAELLTDAYVKRTARLNATAVSDVLSDIRTKLIPAIEPEADGFQSLRAAILRIDSLLVQIAAPAKETARPEEFQTPLLNSADTLRSLKLELKVLDSQRNQARDPLFAKMLHDFNVRLSAALQREPERSALAAAKITLEAALMPLIENNADPDVRRTLGSAASRINDLLSGLLGERRAPARAEQSGNPQEALKLELRILEHSVYPKDKDKAFSAALAEVISGLHEALAQMSAVSASPQLEAAASSINELLIPLTEQFKDSPLSQTLRKTLERIQGTLLQLLRPATAEKVPAQTLESLKLDIRALMTIRPVLREDERAVEVEQVLSEAAESPGAELKDVVFRLQPQPSQPLSKQTQAALAELRPAPAGLKLQTALKELDLQQLKQTIELERSLFDATKNLRLLLEKHEENYTPQPALARAAADLAAVLEKFSAALAKAIPAELAADVIELKKILSAVMQAPASDAGTPLWKIVEQLKNVEIGLSPEFTESRFISFIRQHLKTIKLEPQAVSKLIEEQGLSGERLDAYLNQLMKTLVRTEEHLQFALDMQQQLKDFLEELRQGLSKEGAQQTSFFGKMLSLFQLRFSPHPSSPLPEALPKTLRVQVEQIHAALREAASGESSLQPLLEALARGDSKVPELERRFLSFTTRLREELTRDSAPLHQVLRNALATMRTEFSAANAASPVFKPLPDFPFAQSRALQTIETQIQALLTELPEPAADKDRSGETQLPVNSQAPDPKPAAQQQAAPRPRTNLTTELVEQLFLRSIRPPETKQRLVRESAALNVEAKTDAPAQQLAAQRLIPPAALARVQALEKFETLLKGQELLNQLNPLMRNLGEPAFVLFPAMFEGLISYMELALYGPADTAKQAEVKHRQSERKVEEVGADGRGNNKRDRSAPRQHLAFRLTLPSLGPVGVEFEETLHQALVTFTLESQGPAEFVKEQLPGLQVIFRGLGFGALDFNVVVGPVQSVKPGWISEAAGTSIAVA